MALPLLKDELFDTIGQTDWFTISALRETYGLAAPDFTGPARLLALLAALGIAGREQDGLVLLDAASESPRLVALVSAEELFAVNTQRPRFRCPDDPMAAATEIFNLKVGMYQEDCRDLAGANALLYVVDMDGWLSKAQNRYIARLLEQDIRTVRKFVCSCSELGELLANPFGRRHKGLTVSQVEAQPADQEMAPTTARNFGECVTHPFVRVRNSYQHIEKLHQHPDASRLLALASNLVRRVLGSEFELVHGSADVMVDRCGERSGMPWFCLSNGEQYGLAFCAFIALAAEDATAESWVGVTDALTCLDLRCFLAAIDVLSDFVIATGANVYIQTNNSSYRSLAENKLRAAANGMIVQAD